MSASPAIRLILALLSSSALALVNVGCPASAAQSPPHEINITTDSAPGWLPSAAQESAARRSLDDYLAALDAGHVVQAYAMLTAGQQHEESLTTFSVRNSKFNATAGPVKERRILKVTWTKNPATAPVPGVYVAFDLVSRFANVDRHCGYVVLYQDPADGAFRVTREENNYIDNAAANAIERDHSRAGLDRAWTDIASHCPSYDVRAAIAAEPLAESPGSSIGYPSVAAALAALRNKPGVAISQQNGWTVATEASTLTIWSFAPRGNPAYPAVAKRHVVEDKKATWIDMTIACEASKAACDDFVRTFEALDAKVSESSHAGH